MSMRRVATSGLLRSPLGRSAYVHNRQTKASRQQTKTERTTKPTAAERASQQQSQASGAGPEWGKRSEKAAKARGASMVRNTRTSAHAKVCTASAAESDCRPPILSES